MSSGVGRDLRLDLEKSPNPRRVLAEVSDAWELSEAGSVQ